MITYNDHHKPCSKLLELAGNEAERCRATLEKLHPTNDAGQAYQAKVEMQLWEEFYILIKEKKDQNPYAK